MIQLDLLSYALTPEEAAETPPQPKSPINRHEIAFYEAKASVYLRFMNNIMASSRLLPHVKRHEIIRLHQLRSQALARVKELEE
ncbi:MAG: hypothetical protein SFY66_19550 [Oculatellaceae cyanobacterium bins.114]|nr:hypothetical protein [Oculatellaceae cyanobacterium bins.114]